MNMLCLPPNFGKREKSLRCILGKTGDNSTSLRGAQAMKQLGVTCCAGWLPPARFLVLLCDVHRAEVRAASAGGSLSFAIRRSVVFFSAPA